MNYYNTEIVSPVLSSHKKEQVDLQQLNNKFSIYAQKIRLLNEQANILDVGAFLKQTRALEEDVSNLKTLYEKELDALRQEVNTIGREKSNYQLQCEKYKWAAIDLETRLSVEMDKNHTLMEAMSQMEQKMSTLKTELINFRQAGDGKNSVLQLQRERDKIVMENDGHKCRLQLPITTTQPDAPAYTAQLPLSLPAVSLPVSINPSDCVTPLSPAKQQVDKQYELFPTLDSESQSLVHVSQAEPLVTQIPFPGFPESVTHDSIGTTQNACDTTPSINRMYISNEPSNTPMTIAPVSRAKSVPVVRPRSSVQIVQTSYGQGKDNFDFKDLKKETLYIQTRPKSSPLECSPTAISKSRADSAVGNIKILEVNQEGRYIRLFNEGKLEVGFGGYMIQQTVGGHPVAIFRFPPQTKFPMESTLTVWSATHDPLQYHPTQDFTWKELQKWGTGPECTTLLCKPNGQAAAWVTAAHRFTKNIYERFPKVHTEDVNSKYTEDVNSQCESGGTSSGAGRTQVRKLKNTSTSWIDSSRGTFTKSIKPGVTSPPPHFCQTPHKRFNTGLEQLKSQHCQHFQPPMPRPPLFSTW